MSGQPEGATAAERIARVRAEAEAAIAAACDMASLDATRIRYLGRKAPARCLHLITQTTREIVDVFIGLGFSVVEGPEVETAYYSFDALKHARHASLAADDGHVLCQASRRHL
jgi:phenylalanyl-tRNA synthetase alpha chain